MPNKKIPIFDLDWTLITGGSVLHKQSLVWAVYQVLGEKRQIDFDIQGDLDSNILYRLALSITKKEQLTLKYLPKLINLTNLYFNSHIKDSKFLPMPGSEQLLNSLKDGGFTIGVLTGNTKSIGEYKLKSSNLYKYIDYAVYGDKHVRRFELIGDIYKQISIDNKDIKLQDLVIVGDSPRDIECAKNGYLKCIAVATGKFNKNQLKKADLVIDTLEDTQKIFQFLV